MLPLHYKGKALSGCNPHPSRGRQLVVVDVEVIEHRDDATRTPRGDSNALFLAIFMP